LVVISTQNNGSLVVISIQNNVSFIGLCFYHTCCDTGLGFSGLIRRTTPFIRLLHVRHVR
jgi:hypothetical protein